MHACEATRRHAGLPGTSREHHSTHTTPHDNPAQVGATAGDHSQYFVFILVGLARAGGVCGASHGRNGCWELLTENRKMVYGEGSN